jgi:regulator of sigma E protease
LDHNEHIQRDDDMNPAHQPPEEHHHPDSSGADAPDAPPRTLGEWIQSNLIMLVLIIAAVGFLVWKFDVLAILKVALGLGFIIFIHELGHFLVAKWCDVHVTTFSIGFGPALPGCSFTWGETTYKLAVFPLGGYVQMVGQIDADESSDGSEDDPRSYRNKTVWQRMAIISAGVTMNAIFACIAFTVIFLGPGKPRQAAVVAAVDSGKPAFTKGLRTGSTILRVNEIENPYFEDLKFETIATMNPITVVTQRQHGVDPNKRDVDPKPVTKEITPHQGSVRMIGIAPTVKLQLASRKMAPGYDSPAFPGSTAAKADKPFAFDDVIVAMSDPSDPKKVTPLPDDPRNPGSGMKDFFEFQRRMILLAGQPVIIQVERGPEGAKELVNITVAPMYHRTLGARMKMGQIVAVRENSEADQHENSDPSKPKLVWTPSTMQERTLDGDVIEKVVVKDERGQVITWEKGKNLDPVKLPFELKQWADRLWTAHNQNPPADQRKVRLYLKRRNTENASTPYLPNPVVVELTWDQDWRFDRVMAMVPASPQAIPELGLAYLVKNEVDTLDKDFPTGGLQKDDEIVDLNLYYVKPDGSEHARGWDSKGIKGTEWAHLFLRLQTPEVTKVVLKIKRGGKEQELEVVPQEDKGWPMDERGLMLTYDNRVERADNVLAAIGMGFRDTYRSIMQVYLHLRGLVARTISVENLGGPVAITTTAYRVAQYDFWEFVFFLGLISVNLAVLNFLPIPVLDGGHMVFLIYEKLRGKPASEGVRIGATYAGLLLLGCLMIFVLVLDVRRLVGGS